jgi:outer membrane lipoprotein SlyB
MFDPMTMLGLVVGSTLGGVAPMLVGGGLISSLIGSVIGGIAGIWAGYRINESF